MNTRKISVPVLWDSIGNFKDNEQCAVSVDSIVVGVVDKPTGPRIPGYGNGETTSTLQIKDVNFGTLYLSLTEEEYMALVANSGTSPDELQVYNWVGGVDIDPGSIVTDPRLDGIHIDSINKGGITIYHYTHEGSVLDLISDGGLAEDEHIQIFYKN